MKTIYVQECIDGCDNIRVKGQTEDATWTNWFKYPKQDIEKSMRMCDLVFVDSVRCSECTEKLQREKLLTRKNGEHFRPL